MESIDEYIQRRIELFGELSDEFRHESLTDTQKKLYRLILEAFAFSANTLIKIMGTIGEDSDLSKEKLAELWEIHTDEARQQEKLK